MSHSNIYNRSKINSIYYYFITIIPLDIKKLFLILNKHIQSTIVLRYIIYETMRYFKVNIISLWTFFFYAANRKIERTLNRMFLIIFHIIFLYTTSLLSLLLLFLKFLNENVILEISKSRKEHIQKNIWYFNLWRFFDREFCSFW